MASLLWVCLFCGLSAESGFAASPEDTQKERAVPIYPPPAVTNGLIHRWVNLFDVHDEVTGLEGRIMGVVPPVPPGQNDDTAFDQPAGWVELQPPITNEVFTVCFWARLIPFADPASHPPLEFEPFESLFQWLFSDRFNLRSLIESCYKPFKDTESQKASYLAWHFYLFSGSRSNGFICSVDERDLVGSTFHWRPTPNVFSFGNVERGDLQWRGVLRDLVVFDRILSKEEIARLRRSGLPDNFPRNTPARQRATSQKISSHWNPVVETRQLREFRHRHFTTENGLPSNTVRAVLQTRDGLLWIATDEGLAQFDGTDFTTYSSTNTPALTKAGDNVYTLNEGPDGTVWAGTSAGLIRVRAGQVSWFSSELLEPSLIACVGDTNGTVWVAGYQIGKRPLRVCQVRHFDPERQRLSAPIGVPGIVRRMVATPDGLWFSTEQPDLLLFWDRKAAVPKVIVSLARTPVRIGVASIPTTPEGSEPILRLWEAQGNPIGWRAASLQIPNTDLSFEWIGGTNRTKEMVDTVQQYGTGNGEHWIADRDDILLAHRDRLERILPMHADPIQAITSLSPNREGGVWLGTERDGIHFIQEPAARLYNARDGLRNTEVNSVANVTTGLVALATGDGVCTFNGTNFHYFPGNNSIVFAVAESRDGLFWAAADVNSVHAVRIGTQDQVIMPKLKRRPMWRFPYGIHEVSEGYLAFLTRDGLFRFAPNASADRRAPEYLDRGEMVIDALGKEIPTNTLRGLTSDTQGRFWIGTKGAGLLRGVGTNRIERLTSAQGVPGDYCTVLRRDSKGFVWFQTEHGLARWRNNVFESASYAQGVPHDRFSDILEDGLGYYWLPGKAGLHRLSEADLNRACQGQAVQIKTLTLGADDGLGSAGCSTTICPSSARDASGRLFIATPNGLAVVDPRRVRDRPPLSPPRLRRMLVNRKELPLTPSTHLQGLSLAPGSGSSLEVEFGSINLTHPEDLEYSYRLSGFDDRWSDRSRRQHGVFTNVRPGNYQLQVKAFNRRTRQESDPLSLPMILQPHFWQTPSFAILVVAGLLAGAAAFHISRLRIQAREKARELKQQLLEERERIAADLHDELGAVMTKIAIQGENVKSSVEQEHHSQTKLNQIIESARQATVTISDMVWVTNPSNHTLSHLAAQLRQRTHQLVEDSGIELELRFDDAPSIPVSATLERNLLMIAREAVNNALKHSGTRRLDVCLKVLRTGLHFSVTDHGRGVSGLADVRGGNGLGNIRRRVKALGGDLEIQSSKGSGTHIAIRIPLS